jgi:hypothetical protein
MGVLRRRGRYAGLTLALGESSAKLVVLVTLGAMVFTQTPVTTASVRT